MEQDRSSKGSNLAVLDEPESDVARVIEGETAQYAVPAFITDRRVARAARPRKRFFGKPLAWSMAVLLALGLLYLGLSGLAATSQPGDLLYGFKLWQENSAQAFSSTTEERLNRALGYAENRLREMERLMLEGRSELLEQPALEYRKALNIVFQLKHGQLTPEQRARLEDQQNRLRKALSQISISINGGLRLALPPVQQQEIEQLVNQIDLQVPLPEVTLAPATPLPRPTRLPAFTVVALPAATQALPTATAGASVKIEPAQNAGPQPVAAPSNPNPVVEPGSLPTAGQSVTATPLPPLPTETAGPVQPTVANPPAQPQVPATLAAAPATATPVVRQPLAPTQPKPQPQPGATPVPDQQTVPPKPTSVPKTIEVARPTPKPEPTQAPATAAPVPTAPPAPTATPRDKEDDDKGKGKGKEKGKDSDKGKDKGKNKEKDQG